MQNLSHLNCCPVEMLFKSVSPWLRGLHISMVVVWALLNLGTLIKAIESRGSF